MPCRLLLHSAVLSFIGFFEGMVLRMLYFVEEVCCTLSISIPSGVSGVQAM